MKGSKRWKDWNNKKLKNIAWYDSINDSQDEPTKVIFNHLLMFNHLTYDISYVNNFCIQGDKYAYLKPKDSTIFGGTDETLRGFICLYSIQDICDAELS